MRRDEMERVILVDADDVEIGTAPKLEAHRSGVLHRAFSVFILNSAGDLLLQRRAAGKYHSPGLWSNTCCGHPRPGEDTRAAAERRLYEEMGVQCEVERLGGFTYRAQFADGLWEHEFDHVFVGVYDGEPRPDPAEVGEWRWQEMEAVREEVHRDPRAFTAWFGLALASLRSAGRV
jgi:isopentenyl-diphosphate Delta-isomerase